MMQIDFNPLFWRGIVIGAIVVVFIVGAIAVHAVVAAGYRFARRAPLSPDAAAGTRNGDRVVSSSAPTVRGPTVHAAGNDLARPRPVHKEAA